MSLVDLESTDQKGGYECQAKQYLEDGTVAAGIDSTNKALWVFFDREAISELQKSIIGEMIGNPIEIATLAYTDKVKLNWMGIKQSNLELKQI